VSAFPRLYQPRRGWRGPAGGSPKATCWTARTWLACSWTRGRTSAPFTKPARWCADLSTVAASAGSSSAW